MPTSLIPNELARGPAVDLTITGCFARQVDLHGDRVAVREAKREVTYAALDCQANRVAHVVCSLRREADLAPVALLAEAGAEYAAGILGILKAGKAYAPLGPRQPAIHQRAILADCGARILMSDAANAGRAREIAGDRIAVVEIGRLNERYSDRDPCVSLTPDVAAYVIYTSGTAGAPKGVIVNHRTVVHNAWVAIDDLGLIQADRTALLLSPAHGLAASVLFHTLLSGGTLCPFDLRGQGLRALGVWLREERVSVVKATPSVARGLVGAMGPGDFLPHLRYLWISGEPVYRDDLAALWPFLGEECRIIVSLSATETKEICRLSIDRATVFETETVPVGRPVKGKRVRLLDDADREVEKGEIGELWVQSRFLADGYWRDPDLTRARFRPVPDAPNERMYNTGDLARVGGDGSVEVCGRRDLQVKIRGYRIQMEEVEAALRRVAGVKDAAVIKEAAGTDVRLVGLVVCDVKETEPGNIRASVGELVPDYMVPARLLVVDALPLGASGKIDRCALIELVGSEDKSPPATVSPRNRTERVLLDLARVVLPDGDPGLTGDFFAAGGDSLSAAILIARVDEIYGVEASMGDFLAHPSLAWLANHIHEKIRETAGSMLRQISLLVGIAGRPWDDPLYVVPGGGGSEIELFFATNELFYQLGKERRVIGLRAVTPDGRLAAGADVRSMADRFAKEIRAHQTQGPYALIGECGGGMLAIEIARCLLAQGQQVHVVMLDPLPLRRGGYLRSVSRRSFRKAVKRWIWAAERIFHHIREAGSLRGPERWSYVREKLGRTPKVVREMQTRPDYHPDRSLAERIAAGREAYKRALLRFRPDPFGGTITLAVSDSRKDAVRDWTRWAASRIDVLRMPGDHHSAIRAHAPETARLILGHLAARGDRAGGAAASFGPEGVIQPVQAALRSLPNEGMESVS